MGLELWVWIYGAGSMGLDVWGWIYGAGCVGLDLWGWIMGLDVWGWIYGAECWPPPTVTRAYAQLAAYQQRHNVNPLRGFLVPLVQVGMGDLWGRRGGSMGRMWGGI